MDNNKTFLTGLALLSVVILGAAFLLRPSPQIQVLSGPDAQPNVISVSGVGRLDVKPDTAVVTLGFNQQAKTAQDAQAMANESMDAVLKAVKEKGIPEDKIRTSSFNLHAEYDYSDKGSPVLIGYRVNSTITVTIQNLDSVGPAIDASIEAGANQVQNIVFTLKDTDKHKQQAIDEALEDARTKAEKSAEKLGATVIGVRRLTVGEPSSGGGQPGIYVKAMEAGDQSRMAMQVQPGELEVTTMVQVEFMLGNK